MLKLYYAPAACSLAPHILLEETKLPFELVKVDLRAKTFSGGDYYKINPKGSVPALQVNSGEILTETAIILQYVADQKPETNLIPRAGTWERYRCQEWLNFIASEIHKGFGPLWKPDTPAEYKPIALKNLTQKLNFVNAYLEKNNYLMGSSYTVADAYLFTVINWSHFLKIDLSPWPNLLSFMGRIKERPATLAALKAEGLMK